MKNSPSRCSWLLIALVLCIGVQIRAADPAFHRQEDVIYGRKFGMALTMDVFRPIVAANHAGVILVCSGGWFSSRDFMSAPVVQAWLTPLLNHGYTVFGVVHGSQPRFTITDAVADLHRSVRFIRYHATDYGIDPNRLGITGGSAGGHLSLMMGVQPVPGDPKNADPVEREESRVQAVACFFPPTDFLNYGAPGKLAWQTNLNWLLPPFDFQKQLKDGRFVLLTGKDKLAAAMKVSPIYYVSPASAPTLIIQGDADVLVPFEQSERFIAKLKDAGVPGELVLRHGKNHGWPDVQPDVKLLTNWFDKYLLQSSTTPPVKATP